ncbi:unnamed protein product [Rhodiola kirilowii]
MMLMWNPDIFGINIWFASSQIIICEVKWKDQSFMAGFLYAMNFQRDRSTLWETIVDAVERFDGPWLFSGDFNCVWNQQEKLNGRRFRDADGREINALFEQTGLRDISASGNFYTWSDRHDEGARIWCNLDRIIVNEKMSDLFPSIKGLFPESGISDHCPAITFLEQKLQVKKWFRFQAFWTKTEEFAVCIRDKWQRGTFNLFQLQAKLKNLKGEIKCSMRENRGDMSIRVEQSRLRLMSIQRQLAGDPDCAALRLEETHELRNFRKILKYQFIFNSQRARLNWAKEGDLNSRYFHSVIKGRRSKSSIHCVKLGEGDYSFDPTVIKEQFVNHFKELLNGQHSRVPVAQEELCEGPKVKEADCFLLVKEVSYNEIAEIVKNLPSFKAAGPDGYNAEFFKASWPLIEKDLLDSIRNFMLTSVMPSGINSTFLALIPKVKNACCPVDFRPISCCNVVYKIISTLLANRLKPVLKYLVNEAQSAFVEERNIAYNINLVQELLGNYNRKGVSKRCMLKLDILKAYDTVDWRFLQQTLEIFGFPLRFITWIMACVSSVKFSVLINGSMEGYFGSSRGLRQGDPISPYLFTLLMEVLSRLLGNMKRTGNFDYHPKCARISLSHLMFADDVIIFSKANSGSLNQVRDVLRTFHDWSGLKVNVDKSAIYFGGCSEGETNLFASIVNFQKGHLPFTYLGVPLHGRKLKVSDYSVIIHKMTSKIKSWSAKCLSYAGRLVLVKHVLSAIGSYWMRVLVFPSCVLKKISAICRNFLWSGTLSGKRNLVAWKKVCKPKEEGGLGIMNLCHFNKALLLGQIWDLVRKKDLLWI